MILAHTPNGRIAEPVMRGLQRMMPPRARPLLWASRGTRVHSSRCDAAPKLSLRQLRDLALLCGRNTTGTKPVLHADLQTAKATAGNQPAGCRILSIDMGVRNLAYCLLQVGQGEVVPKLVAWERLSLVDDDDKPEAEAEEHSTDAPSSPSSCPYSPPVMAAVAARLVRDRLLPLAPSHILIERQRFRSGGAAAVLEWTVRVNSLEAMLHGIFAARQLAEYDSGQTSLESVQAVSPRRVAQFVVRGGLAGRLPSSVSVPRKATKEKDIKDIKEALVATILRSDGGESSRLLSHDADSHVSDMVAAYLARWDAKQKKTRKKTKGSAQSQPRILLSKIDDLADCIAQGLVWLEWVQNTKALRDKGAEFLLDTSRLQE